MEHMKQLKYIVFAVAGLFMNHAQGQSAVDSSYVFSGYTDRLSLFNKMPVSKKSIIYLGDSLTEAGRWKDIAPEYPILNRGISGDNSFGVYARLEEVLRHQPEKLFLMIGVNDLKRGIPATYIIRNYERIVHKILKDSPQTKVYLNSILPINNKKLIEAFKSVSNHDIHVLNEALLKISHSDKRIQFIDLHKVLADENNELKSELTPDGIHLEMHAYTIVIEYLKKMKVL